jgi:hypothetical protein
VDRLRHPPAAVGESSRARWLYCNCEAGFATNNAFDRLKRRDMAAVTKPIFTEISYTKLRTFPASMPPAADRSRAPACPRELFPHTLALASKGRNRAGHPR